jgi:two-component system response regulator YesN
MQACRDENVYDTDFILNLIMTSSHTYKELEEKVYETLIDYVASSNDEQNASVEYTIERVAEYLDNHYQEKLLIQDVAEMFGFNYSYLCKQFKTVKKISPNEYMIVKRMERAKELLCKCREVSIKEIAELVGYTDQYYFSRIFKLYEKCTPSEYRKMNER